MPDAGAASLASSVTDVTWLLHHKCAGDVGWLLSQSEVLRDFPVNNLALANHNTMQIFLALSIQQQLMPTQRRQHPCVEICTCKNNYRRSP